MSRIPEQLCFNLIQLSKDYKAINSTNNQELHIFTGEAILIPEVHNMANITPPEQCPRFVNFKARYTQGSLLLKHAPGASSVVFTKDFRPKKKGFTTNLLLLRFAP